MTQALIQTVGEALYGPLWQSQIARALAVSDRTVRRWASGANEPPPSIWQDIAELADARRDAIKAVLPAIYESANPS